jgi:hypothetical protein
MKLQSIVFLCLFAAREVAALAPPSTRREALGWIVGGACTSAGCIVGRPWAANAADTPEGVDVDSFMRTGMVSQPMGVSGQAGKSKPDLGIILRYVS